MSSPQRLQPCSLSRPLRSASKKPATMSVAQTYYLATKARGKLSLEAAQPDHDLRLLVGHANLLDSLMLELADAEREQERWFNQSVGGASQPTPPRHVQWADTLASQHPVEVESDSEGSSDSDDFEDSDDGDDDDDDDFDEHDFEIASFCSSATLASSSSLATVPSRVPPAFPVQDDDGICDDLEEDYAQLELVRTPSHSHSPPLPELMDPDTDTSDDEQMPPSPADATLPYREKDGEASLYDDEYYSPRRNSTSLVSTISVYYL